MALDNWGFVSQFRCAASDKQCLMEHVSALEGQKKKFSRVDKCPDSVGRHGSGSLRRHHSMQQTVVHQPAPSRPPLAPVSCCDGSGRRRTADRGHERVQRPPTSCPCQWWWVSPSSRKQEVSLPSVLPNRAAESRIGHRGHDPRDRGPLLPPHHLLLTVQMTCVVSAN